MGIEKLVEEAAGVFAAEKALEAVDPNAGILAKGAAAIAGFAGASKLNALLDGAAKPAAQPAAAADEQPATDDSTSDQTS